MASVQDGRSSQTTRSSNENYMFDGNSGNFYSWVNKLEARQPRSTKQVELLRPLLAGNALEVYNRLDVNVKDHYDLARRALVRVYPPNVFEAYTEIMSRVRRPTELITSYCEDLLTLIKYFLPSLEQESPNSYLVLFKSAFFAGLPEHIRRQFESRPISSMDQMQEVISQLDSNISIIGEDTVKKETTMDSPYGVKFNEQYAVAKIRGKGSYGTVFEACNVSDLCWYAVKEVKVKVQTIDFLEKEAQRHQKLKHDHVVKYVHCFRDTIRYMPFDDCGPTEINNLTSSRHMEVSDSDSSNPQDESGVCLTSSMPVQVASSTSRRDPGMERPPPSSGTVSALYIFMELCDMSLGEYLHAYRQKIDRCVVWEVARQILEALKHLQDNNIGHGDLHAGNILLKLKQQSNMGTRDLRAYDIKLCDFGLRTFGRRTFSENSYPVQDQQNSDLYQVGHIALLLLVHPRSDSEAHDIWKKCIENAEFPAGVELSEERIIKMMISGTAKPADVLVELNLVSPKTQPTQRVTTKL